MKKQLFNAWLLACVVCLCVACGSDDDDKLDASLLQGKWETFTTPSIVSSSLIQVYYEFKSDGTFTRTSPSSSSSTVGLSGTYVFDVDNLIIKLHLTQLGTSLDYEVVSLDKNTLVWYSGETGWKEELTRVAN